MQPVPVPRPGPCRRGGRQAAWGQAAWARSAARGSLAPRWAPAGAHGRVGAGATGDPVHGSAVVGGVAAPWWSTAPGRRATRRGAPLQRHRWVEVRVDGTRGSSTLQAVAAPDHAAAHPGATGAGRWEEAGDGRVLAGRQGRASRSTARPGPLAEVGAAAPRRRARVRRARRRGKRASRLERHLQGTGSVPGPLSETVVKAGAPWSPAGLPEPRGAPTSPVGPTSAVGAPSKARLAARERGAPGVAVPVARASTTGGASPVRLGSRTAPTLSSWSPRGSAVAAVGRWVVPRRGAVLPPLAVGAPSKSPEALPATGAAPKGPAPRTTAPAPTTRPGVAPAGRAPLTPPAAGAAHGAPTNAAGRPDAASRARCATVASGPRTLEAGASGAAAHGLRRRSSTSAAEAGMPSGISSQPASTGRQGEAGAPEERSPRPALRAEGGWLRPSARVTHGPPASSRAAAHTEGAASPTGGAALQGALAVARAASERPRSAGPGGGATRSRPGNASSGAGSVAVAAARRATARRAGCRLPSGDRATRLPVHAAGVAGAAGTPRQVSLLACLLGALTKTPVGVGQDAAPRQAPLSDRPLGAPEKSRGSPPPAGEPCQAGGAPHPVRAPCQGSARTDDTPAGWKVRGVAGFVGAPCQVEVIDPVLAGRPAPGGWDPGSETRAPAKVQGAPGATPAPNHGRSGAGDRAERGQAVAGARSTGAPVQGAEPDSARPAPIQASRFAVVARAPAKVRDTACARRAPVHGSSRPVATGDGRHGS